MNSHTSEPKSNLEEEDTIETTGESDLEAASSIDSSQTSESSNGVVCNRACALTRHRPNEDGECLIASIVARPLRCLCAHYGVSILSIAAIAIQVAVEFMRWAADVRDLGRIPLCISSGASTITLGCWLTFELLRRVAFAQQARRVLFFGWVHEILLELTSHVHGGASHWVLLTLSAAACGGSNLAAMGAVRSRVAHTFKDRLGSRTLVVAQIAAAGPQMVTGTMAASIATRACITGSDSGWTRFLQGILASDWYWVTCCVTWILAWASATFIAAWSFSVVSSAAQTPMAARAGSYVHAEAVWARSVIRRSRGVIVFACACCAVMNAVRLGLTVCHMLGLIQDTAMLLIILELNRSVYMFVEFIFLLMIIGYFRPRRPDAWAPALQRSISTASCRTPTPKPTPRSSTWHDKVRELAERNVTVDELLSFYSQLGQGDVMPHYDPHHHTTNDVVRGAIIPLSRLPSGGGAAYASTLPWRTVSTQLPERMVTHDWRNLFLHLVAAVVANALGECEYSRVADTLVRSGVASLRRKLAKMGALHIHYWICAFCVNQHANICGGFGSPPPEGTPDYVRWDANRRDSVSGKLHIACPCHERKFFNDSTDKCELNKFDDMMALLLEEQPNFCQVAAVDRHFNIFTRVWCIAEFVQAYLTEVPQSICTLSNKALDADNEDLSIYVKLATLTVLECSASRPEDKALILAKIPDVAEFDARLQAMIFGERGLLSKHLVGFD
eukprot:CAMPEP_0115430330 /NCGR_PEP_ID=MMETSP0271-20121206/30989_1 /TAXON_ID=71861 /ORGANISM="Scrippsiella trochoidea, Strain CCMP3099" /LENGTH=729 /DNA_ID=CAMNT_0002855555 /DNA_START=52 /DNA_END=2239 /DNA_ORIENTATION=-